MRSPYRRDLALTLGLAVLFWLPARHALDPAGWLLLVAGVGPLALRRRFPLAVVLATTAAYATWALSGYPTHPLGALPTLVAVYGLGAEGTRPVSRIAGIGAAVVTFLAVAVGMMGLPILEGVFFSLLFVGVWWVGTLIRTRAEVTAELEATRQELAERAVTEERARIARDLHDVIAHTMGVVAVQAGVGAHLAATDPEKALATLETISQASHTAMTELRRLLTLLTRPGDEDEERVGLADLTGLASMAERAGLTVTLRTSGPIDTLPAGLDLTAYRIIQESITNAIKHMPGSAVTVDVAVVDATLSVEVVSTGQRRPAPAGDRGMGARGIRERAALFGGEVEMGPIADGWRVTARLPVAT